MFRLLICVYCFDLMIVVTEINSAMKKCGRHFSAVASALVGMRNVIGDKTQRIDMGQSSAFHNNHFVGSHDTKPS